MEAAVAAFGGLDILSTTSTRSTGAPTASSRLPTTTGPRTLDRNPFFAKYLPTGNTWAIFKAYLDEAARRIADPIVAAYAGKLAAVNVFTIDNAFAMLESHGSTPGARDVRHPAVGLAAAP
jgi:hypothetical protein